MIMSMSRTTSGILTALVCAVLLVLCSRPTTTDPYLALPDDVQTALTLGLLGGLGLMSHGIQRRVQRGDYAKKTAALVVLAFLAAGCATTCHDRVTMARDATIIALEQLEPYAPSALGTADAAEWVDAARRVLELLYREWLRKCEPPAGELEGETFDSPSP